MTLKNRRVAVLGAGIMGASLALLLARCGAKVTLIDREMSAMACASRWNEGKIHLGFIYGADPTLQTARHIIPGGLLFGQVLSDLIDSDISGQITRTDDTLLVHRNSIVGQTDLQALFAKICTILRDHPDAGRYLTDLRHARAEKLSAKYLAQIADTAEIVAGFHMPERSINTQWVADRIAAALAAERGIEQRLGVTILSARPADLSTGQWRVSGSPVFSETYDLVINALWNGRPGIDQTAGVEADLVRSNRYRLSVFARTSKPVEARSAIIGVGPFGDVKNYNSRDFYLSWYPAGLVADTSDLVPPLPEIDAKIRAAVLEKTRSKLSVLLPPVANIFDTAESLRIEGGFVFARGQGHLADPKATLHQRHMFGMRRLGNYLSLDTGKYSTAPFMARNLVAMLDGRS